MTIEPPVLCPSGIFCGARHSSPPWRRQSSISLSQASSWKERNQTLNLLRIDMIRFSLIKSDDPNKKIYSWEGILKGLMEGIPHTHPPSCRGVSALESGLSGGTAAIRRPCWSARGWGWTPPCSTSSSGEVEQISVILLHGPPDGTRSSWQGCRDKTTLWLGALCHEAVHCPSHL